MAVPVEDEDEDDDEKKEAPESQEDLPKPRKMGLIERIITWIRNLFADHDKEEKED